MSLSKWIRLLAICVICLGTFFRVFHVDHKIYWEDETLTLLRASGYREADKAELLENSNKILTAGELQSYQKLSSRRGFSDTMTALYERPEHSPLYFITVRLGMQWIHNSKSIARVLSVLFSLMTLPFAYWLCIELFRSPRVSWTFTALISISPLHVLYAQEARPYSLWSLIICLSGVALLRAIRLKTLRSWAIYCITVSLGLYSSLLSGIVFISYGIFTFISNNFRLTRNILSGAIASVLGLLTFLPWLWIFTSRVSGPPEWSIKPVSTLSLIRELLNNLVYLFGDFWFFFSYYPESTFDLGYGKILVPLTLLLILWAYYQVLKLASPQERWFVLALTGSTSIFLLMVDLKNGSYLSTMSRYLIPSYMGVQLAVAFALVKSLENNSHFSLRRRVWKVITIGIVVLGVISCSVSAQSPTWWNKRTTSYDTLRMSQVIQEIETPIVFIHPRYFLLSLSHYLSPETSIQLSSRELDLGSVPSNFSDIFFIGMTNGPPKLKPGRQDFDAKQVYKGRKASLWRINQKS